MRKALAVAVVVLSAGMAHAQFCYRAGSIPPCIQTSPCPSGFASVSVCPPAPTPTPVSTPAPTPVPTAAQTDLALIQAHLGAEWKGGSSGAWFQKNCKENLSYNPCIYFPQGAKVYGYTIQTSVKLAGVETLMRVYYDQDGLLDNGAQILGIQQHQPATTCPNTLVVARTLYAPIILPAGTYVWLGGDWFGNSSGHPKPFEFQVSLDVDAGAVVQKVTP